MVKTTMYLLASARQSILMKKGVTGPGPGVGGVGLGGRGDGATDSGAERLSRCGVLELAMCGGYCLLVARINRAGTIVSLRLVPSNIEALFKPGS